MSETTPIRYDREIPDVLQAMGKVHKTMDSHGLGRTIHHLVQLRASQINRCAYCVKMHTREAREDETFASPSTGSGRAGNLAGGHR